MVKDRVEADALESHACDLESASRVKLRGFILNSRGSILSTQERLFHKHTRGLQDSSIITGPRGYGIERLYLGVELVPFLRTKVIESKCDVLPCIIPLSLTIVKTLCCGR